jgi:hypothetical protein
MGRLPARLLPPEHSIDIARARANSQGPTSTGIAGGSVVQRGGVDVAVPEQSGHFVGFTNWIG